MADEVIPFESKRVREAAQKIAEALRDLTHEERFAVWMALSMFMQAFSPQTPDAPNRPKGG